MAPHQTDRRRPDNSYSQLPRLECGRSRPQRRDSAACPPRPVIASLASILEISCGKTPPFDRVQDCHTCSQRMHRQRQPEARQAKRTADCRCSTAKASRNRCRTNLGVHLGQAIRVGFRCSSGPEDRDNILGGFGNTPLYQPGRSHWAVNLTGRSRCPGGGKTQQPTSRRCHSRTSDNLQRPRATRHANSGAQVQAELLSYE